MYDFHGAILHCRNESMQRLSRMQESQLNDGEYPLLQMWRSGLHPRHRPLLLHGRCSQPVCYVRTHSVLRSRRWIHTKQQYDNFIVRMRR